MSRMNLLIDLRGYEGNNANTSRSLFNKNLQQVGINVDRELTQELEIPANTSRFLFSASDIANATPSSGPVFDHKSFSLTTSQDLSYIEIDKKILINSLILSNQRLLGLRGIDYEISFVEDKTRITWVNSWASGGEQALESDEIISVWYAYNPLDQDVQDFSAEAAEAAGVQLFKFLYIEADKECEVIINGSIRNKIKPIVINNVAKKGVFLTSSDINNVFIINNNPTNLIIYYITAK